MNPVSIAIKLALLLVTAAGLFVIVGMLSQIAGSVG